MITHLTPRPAKFSIPSSRGRPCILFINGIFSDTSWEQAMVAWVQANHPEYVAAFFHYDAEALFTGLWANQHADALYAAVISQVTTGGATVVNLFAHSEGNDVVMRMVKRHPDVKGKIKIFFACAAAIKPDCAGNGMNDAIGAGMFEAITCMCSSSDGILGGWGQWFTPYFWGKSLGKDGPKNAVGLITSYWKNDERHVHWTNGDFGNSAGCNLATVKYLFTILPNLTPQPPQRLANGHLRRCDVTAYSAAETAIRAAMHEVEISGCHPLLTESVTLLERARDKVADFVELPKTPGGAG